MLHVRLLHFVFLFNQPMVISVASTFWQLWLTLWTFSYKFLHQYVFSYLGCIPTSEIVGLYDNPKISSLQNCQSIFHSAAPFYISTNMHEGSRFASPCQHFLLSVSLALLIPWVCNGLSLQHLLCIWFPLACHRLRNASPKHACHPLS